MRRHEAHSPLSAYAVSDVDQIAKGDGLFKWNIGVQRVEGMIEVGGKIMRKVRARTAGSVKTAVVFTVHLPQTEVIRSGEISA
jgi:hypothetical protein